MLCHLNVYLVPSNASISSPDRHQVSNKTVSSVTPTRWTFFFFSSLLAGFSFLPPIPLHTLCQLDTRSTKTVEGTTDGKIDFTLAEF